VEQIWFAAASPAHIYMAVIAFIRASCQRIQAPDFRLQYCTQALTSQLTLCGRRGEQTANALENNLSKLESKLDELLASFGDNVGDVPAEKDAGAPDTKSSGQEPDDDAKDLEKKTD
jgi:hypothetical protein